MQTQDIDYRDGPLACRGFLAFDETLSGKRPGVVVVHEGFGLDLLRPRRSRCHTDRKFHCAPISAEF